MIGFKFKYNWYEGDEGSYLVTHPTKTVEEIKIDLSEISVIINEYDYEANNDIQCLPTAYQLTLEFLESRGYSLVQNYCLDEIYLDDGINSTFEFTQKKNKTNWEHKVENFFT